MEIEEIKKRWKDIEIELEKGSSICLQLGDDAWSDIQFLLQRISELEAGWVTYYNLFCGIRDRAKELEASLKLNASMLAKQTDMAREAEARAMKAEAFIRALKL